MEWFRGRLAGKGYRIRVQRPRWKNALVYLIQQDSSAEALLKENGIAVLYTV